MSEKPRKGQSRAELETARTLNTVAIIGGGHALYTSLPDGTRHVVGRVVPKPVKNAGAAVASRVPRLPKSAGKKAALAGAAGWVGFHGMELAGDVMGRRSINAQIDQKKEAAVKSDHGTNLEFVAKRRFDAEADRQRRIGMYSGVLAGSALVAGEGARRNTVITHHDRDTGKQIDRTAQVAAAGKKRALKDPVAQAERMKQAKGITRIGVGRKGALYGGAAALSAIASAAAYRHGISERNKPWN